MNIMHAKLPFAPQDWSVLRSGKYLAKLALFIIVPGLHQIACKRWLLRGAAVHSIRHFRLYDRKSTFRFDNMENSSRLNSQLFVDFYYDCHLGPAGIGLGKSGEP